MSEIGLFDFQLREIVDSLIFLISVFSATALIILFSAGRRKKG